MNKNNLLEETLLAPPYLEDFEAFDKEHRPVFVFHAITFMINKYSILNEVIEGNHMLSEQLQKKEMRVLPSVKKTTEEILFCFVFLIRLCLNWLCSSGQPRTPHSFSFSF